MSENKSADELMFAIAKGDTTWEAVAAEQGISEADFEAWRTALIQKAENQRKPGLGSTALKSTLSILKVIFAFLNPKLAIASLVMSSLAIVTSLGSATYFSLKSSFRGSAGPVVTVGDDVVISFVLIAGPILLALFFGAFGFFSSRRKLALISIGMSLSTIATFSIYFYIKIP